MGEKCFLFCSTWIVPEACLALQEMALGPSGGTEHVFCHLGTLSAAYKGNSVINSNAKPSNVALNSRPSLFWKASSPSLSQVQQGYQYRNSK